MKLQHQHIDDPLGDMVSQAGDSAASIDAWLSVVSRLMHLPEPTRREICAELREHLRERVRDLLLSGSAERDALRLAIDELGETAQLARRLDAANRPHRRRLLMHALLTLVGAGAVAAGVMTFSNSKHAPMPSPARFEGGQSAGDPAAPITATLEEARCTIGADTNMRDALQQVIDQAKVGLMVDWGQIEQQGVDVNQPMGLSFEGMPGPKALTLIARAGRGQMPLDWRMRENDLVEFGVRHELDRREVELMTYDVTDTLQYIAATFTNSPEKAIEQVIGLLTTMVEPENWIDNGGDLAQVQFVGGRLFVQAPMRMQGKVRWILEQLPNGNGDRKAHAGDDEAAAHGGAFARVPIINQYFARLSDVASGNDERAVLEKRVLEAEEALESVRRRYEQQSFPYQAVLSEVATAREALKKWNDAYPQHHDPGRAEGGGDSAVVPLLLNPGDTVTVSIFELYQPNVWATTTRRIDERGMYRVSEIGDVRAAGSSIDQLQTEIARQMASSVMGVTPKVVVAIENSVVPK